MLFARLKSLAELARTHCEQPRKGSICLLKHLPKFNTHTAKIYIGVSKI